MRVRDVMTSPAICVEPTQRVADAIRLMLDRRISGVPVVTARGELVGILSEGDLLRRRELGTAVAHSWLEGLFRSAGRRADDYVRTHGRQVGEIMTERPVTVGPDTPLHEAVATMAQHNIRRLPVVGGGQVVGIVSRGDMLRALLPLLSEPAAIADDASIRKAIESELDAELGLGARDIISVEVHDGAVELRGAVSDDRLRVAARVAAENTRGVTSVADHVVFVEPFAGVSIPPPPL